jgi:geranylgeranyl pyrophosphate synthase
MAGGQGDATRQAQHAWALLYDAAHLIDQVQDDHLTIFPDRNTTLNAAVALFFEAAEQIGQLPLALQTHLFRLMRETVSGQVEDCLNDHPALAEALAIAEKKTGAFMALGCWLGAASCGAPSKARGADVVLDAYLEFGSAYGTLVQIQDDLEWLEGLGTTTRPEAERFSNLVLAAAWALERPESRGELERSVLHLPDASPGEREALRRRLIVLGARAICAAQAQRYSKQALAALASIPVVDRQAADWLKRQVEQAASAFRAKPRTVDAGERDCDATPQTDR